MAKSRRKQAPKRSKRPAAKRAPKKIVLAAGSAKQDTNKRTRLAALGDTHHHAVFMSLAARGSQHNKAPVCYQQLASGWLICFLQSDGTYGQCQPYSGPIHEPRCG